MYEFLERVQVAWLSIGLVLLATACESVSTNQTEVSERGVRSYVFNGDLEDKIAVQNVNLDEDSAVIGISCDVVGLEDEMINVHYQVEWLDQTGKKIGETAVMPLFIRGMGRESISARAPDALHPGHGTGVHLRTSTRRPRGQGPHPILRRHAVPLR